MRNSAKVFWWCSFCYCASFLLSSTLRLPVLSRSLDRVSMNINSLFVYRHASVVPGKLYLSQRSLRHAYEPYILYSVCVHYDLIRTKPSWKYLSNIPSQATPFLSYLYGDNFSDNVFIPRAVVYGISGSFFFSGSLPPPLNIGGEQLPIVDLLHGTPLEERLYLFDLPGTSIGVPFPPLAGAVAHCVVVWLLVCLLFNKTICANNCDGLRTLLFVKSVKISSVAILPLSIASAVIYLMWSLMPYDKPNMIINAAGLDRMGVIAIFSGTVVSYFGTIITVTLATIHKHGLYRPRRADRCANCRYALPVAGPVAGPTEGPGVGPSAESAAGPTAEPCPECGWDRVSVPKRAWRNLRRFAFGALALTVFFYLGPLWISWLAVIL